MDIDRISEDYMLHLEEKKITFSILFELQFEIFEVNLLEIQRGPHCIVIPILNWMKLIQI